jgi:hypothetical protein
VFEPGQVVSQIAFAAAGDGESSADIKQSPSKADLFGHVASDGTA